MNIPTIKDPRCMTKEDRDIWVGINAPFEDYAWEVGINDQAIYMQGYMLSQHETYAEAVKAAIEAVTAIPELAESSWIIY